MKKWRKREKTRLRGKNRKKATRNRKKRVKMMSEKEEGVVSKTEPADSNRQQKETKKGLGAIQKGTT